MNAPHLDDHALSAVLDDASTQAEDAHVAECAACQARLEQLAAVAAAVGAPVAARPPQEVAAAVQRALEQSATPPGAQRANRPAQSPRWVERRWVGAAAALAAVAVVIGGLVALIVRGGHSARTSASTAASAPPRASAAGGPSSGPAVIEAGDLGEQSDPRQLGQAVTARLGGGEPTASPGAAAAGPPRPLSTPAPASPPAGSETRCAGSALAAAGHRADQSGSLRLAASLRWRGQPASVLVFDRAGPSGGRVAVVMRTTDCSPLTTVQL